MNELNQLTILKESITRIEEGTYDDFMMNHGGEIRTSIKQLNAIGSFYNADSLSEEDSKSLKIKLEQQLRMYDDNVVGWIEHIAFQRPDARAIADFAIDNQNRHGTETHMILQAIEEYWDTMQRLLNLDDISESVTEDENAQYDIKEYRAILSRVRTELQDAIDSLDGLDFEHGSGGMTDRAAYYSRELLQDINNAHASARNASAYVKAHE